MGEIESYKDESDAVLSKIPSLPPEIISKICECADRSVLQCLRQVSKQINGYAEPELFRVVHLRVTKASFEKLANIGHAEHLRDHVRVLAYNGRLLPWDLDYHEWQQLLHSTRGWTAVDHEGSPVAWDDILSAIRTSFGSNGLNQCYDEYCILLHDQKAIHHGEKEIEDLVHIFASFPKLASFYLDTGLWMRLTEIPFGRNIRKKPRVLLDAFSQLSAVGQRCLIEPGFTLNSTSLETMKPPKSTFGVKRLLALVEASQQAERQITSLAVSWLDLQHVYQKIEYPEAGDVSTLRDFLGHLKHLRMQFGDWGCSLESWDHAASLIGLAKDLTCLEVEGKSEETHLKDRQTRMSALFKQRFSKLVELVIKGLWIDVEEFQTFVVAHQNLSQLTLHETQYTQGAQQILLEYQDSSGEWEKAKLRHYSTDVDLKLQELAKSKLQDFLRECHVKYVWM